MKLNYDGYGTSGTTTMQPYIGKMSFPNVNLLESSIYFDLELEEFEGGGKYISPQWSFEFVHDGLEIFKMDSTERYSIIEDDSEIEMKELKEVVKKSYDKFVVDAKEAFMKYSISINIPAVSQEGVDKSAEQLHLKLLSLHKSE